MIIKVEQKSHMPFMEQTLTMNMKCLTKNVDMYADVEFEKGKWKLNRIVGLVQWISRWTNRFSTKHELVQAHMTLKIHPFLRLPWHLLLMHCITSYGL